VLAALQDGKAMTAGEVAAATGLARGPVSTTLSRLAKSGELDKAQHGYKLSAASTGGWPAAGRTASGEPPA
jgi:DNA-binding IclR family transcriptional regulator